MLPHRVSADTYFAILISKYKKHTTTSGNYENTDFNPTSHKVSQVVSQKNLCYPNEQKSYNPQS